MFQRLWAAALLPLVFAAPALGGSFDKSLTKLEPEERAHQACILRGLQSVQRDPNLKRADRINASTFGRPALDKSVLTADGGAIHVRGKWFALKFKCELTEDFMKANTFSYVLGAEIQKADWEARGLW